MIALTVVGILITSGGVVGACVWAVAKIKADITDKISEERTRVDTMFEAERENNSRDMRDFALEFAAEQKSQDHNTGEMGASLRRHIEDVEREMHKIEIWGRDNYARQSDLNNSITTVRADISAMRTEIKTDFRDLNVKIDQKA
jgi:hypothetical protein